MNLKDFYYFLDLSQQQSFTGVAQKHGISQPSVSYAIKRLEKEFHCPLIAHDPSHRTFKLTPQGEILLRHIQKVLPEIQGAKKEILRSLSQFNTVGFPPIIIDYLVRKQPAFISNVAALQSIHLSVLWSSGSILSYAHSALQHIFLDISDFCLSRS